MYIVYLVFLFLHQSRDCGFSLEMPRFYVLSKNKKNIRIFFSLKISILHGQVFVMNSMLSFTDQVVIIGRSCKL